MDSEDAVAQGHRAASELRETSAAFDALRTTLLNTLAVTSPGQPDLILKLHMSVQNLTAVRQALMNMVQNGQIAEHAMAAAGLNSPH